MQFRISIVFCLHTVNVKTVLFRICIQKGSYQVLPFWARVDLKVMAMEGYSAFLKASALLETSSSGCLVSYPGYSLGGVLPLCREAVDVFYSPSQMSHKRLVISRK